MTEKGKSIFGHTPAPRAQDVLFCGGRDWQLNACINWYGSGDAYKSGFRSAANQLALEACKIRSEQDIIIYPIAYLYRHHIELVLKDIFLMAASLLRLETTNSQKNALMRHNLLKIWNYVIPLLAPICELAGEEPLPQEDIEGISSYIRQINDYDSGGNSFRYARELNGARSLPENLALINIQDFAIGMEKLSDYLGGLESWIDGLVDETNKYEADLDAQVSLDYI